MHCLCRGDKVWVTNITLRHVICGSRITNSSIVELYATRTTAKTLTMQLKLSRYTEDDERREKAHSSSYSEWNIDQTWPSQEWKSDELMDDRTGRPVVCPQRGAQ